MEDNLMQMEGCGSIPTGLPGGFFVYEAQGEEKILFAEQNIIQLYGCETFEEFLEYVGGSFQGMVHPEDLHKIENQIQAQTLFGEKRHDYVRYRIITKQGDVRYIEDFGHLLHMENGKSVFYVFIVDVDRNEKCHSLPYLPVIFQKKEKGHTASCSAVCPFSYYHMIKVNS